MTLKKRILFVAEYITLSHPGRCFALAEILDPEKYECGIAVSSKVSHMVPACFAKNYDIETIDGKSFIDSVTRGKPAYNAETIEKYVKSELDAIESFKPDLIIGDFRLSLAISSKIANVPYCNLSSIYWKKEEGKKYIVPELAPFTSFIPIRVAQAIFDRLSPKVFKEFCDPINIVAQKYNIPINFENIENLYLQGDYILYDDPLSYNHSKCPHRTEKHIGPINWSLRQPFPEWWPNISSDQPLILICIGSSGKPEIFTSVIKSLLGRKENCVVITAGNQLNIETTSNIFVTDFLPLKEALQNCTLFIGNGGISSYLALAAGVPALGIPHNMDQYLCSAHLEQTGAVRTLRSDRVNARAVTKNIDEMLADQSYRQEALRQKNAMAQINMKESLDDWLSWVLGPCQDSKKNA